MTSFQYFQMPQKKSCLQVNSMPKLSNNGVYSGVVVSTLPQLMESLCTTVLLCDLCLDVPSGTWPHTAPLHLALSCAATSVFLQLHLKPVIHMSFSRSLLQVFFGCPLPLWLCGTYCNTCFAMLLSLLRVCPTMCGWCTVIVIVMVITMMMMVNWWWR